jgi:hypothetical protein
MFERVYTARGEEKARVKIARNLLNDGVPVEKIVQYTELTREEIETLQE